MPTRPDASMTKGVESLALSSNHAVYPDPRLEMRNVVWVPAVVVAIDSDAPGVEVPMPRAPLKYRPPLPILVPPMERSEDGEDVPMPMLPFTLDTSKNGVVVPWSDTTKMGVEVPADP